MPNPQKGSAALIIIFGIVIILVGVGAYYFGTQKNSSTVSTPQVVNTSSPVVSADPTAEWKTFTGPSYSLKLPSEWKDVTPASYDTRFGSINYYQNYAPLVTGGGGFNPEADKGRLTIQIYVGDKVTTLNEFLARGKTGHEDAMGTKDIKWEETQIKLDGQAAVKVKTSNPGFVIFTVHPVTKKGMSISFGLDFDKYNTLATQILSTFKFTEDETANWKSFSGVLYSLKYPADWTAKETKDDYFGTEVKVSNPSQSLVLRVLSGKQPYGFSGQQELKNNNLDLAIEGRTYSVKEVTVDGKSAFVDYVYKKDGKEYDILFGTGYPVGEDKLASFSDYNASRDTLIKILSTLIINID